jgi:uncharacterized protein
VFVAQNLQAFFMTNNIFRHPGVNRIGVFGSYARGNDYNDIDLLLDEDPGYEKRELLKEVVEEKLKEPCDVVVKDKLEPIILHYINKDIVYDQGR